MSTECILVEIHGRVGVLRLNRPQALNALDATLRKDLLKAAERCDADEQIGCIVIIGSDKAFAAGADIKEMAEKSYVDVFAMDYTAEYERLTRVRKPIIAAVAGFALGGGCELAMMCDLIVAADNAKLGQPEIKLGVIPGMGGTRTTHSCDRQEQGDGRDSDRAHDGCRRSGAVWPGRSRRPRGQPVR